MSISKKPVSQYGRVDIAAFRLAERLAKQDPIGAMLWDNGLGQAIEAVICENLPRTNIFAMAEKVKKLPAPGKRLGL
jgi:hypothetical protein